MWLSVGFFIFPLFIHFITCNVVHIKVRDCECGTTKNWNDRIVGGWETKANEYPWMAAIVDKGVLHCGGSIINDLYILTAGHCIRWSNTSTMVVITGAHDIRRASREGTSYKIAQAILHPEFFSHSLYDENDIALLKLNKPIQFTDIVKPICLPKPDYKDPYGQYAIVSGWGRLSSGGRAATNLRQTFVKMLTPAECSKTKMAPYMKKSVYCAYYNNADSCQGDSGGPLIIEQEPGKMVQIGLVSWGMGCASDAPGMYAKVSYYLPWIYQNVAAGRFCKVQ